MTEDRQLKRFFTWKEYEQLVRDLSILIQESEWDFDQILCVARGGMFLGDGLSRLFRKPLAVMMASSYCSKGTQRQLSISAHIAMIGETLGSKVLLVDDLVDSGKTLILLKRELESRYSGVEIRTAVLWNKGCSKTSPDYYAMNVTKECWIVQPFEIYEHL